jgi:hypothetical protein
LLPFKNWDRLGKTFRRSTYDEHSLSQQVEPWVDISDEEAATLPWDGLDGSGALEFDLDDAIHAKEAGLPFIPLGPDQPPISRVLG